MHTYSLGFTSKCTSSPPPPRAGSGGAGASSAAAAALVAAGESRPHNQESHSGPDPAREFSLPRRERLNDLHEGYYQCSLSTSYAL